jgi:hypothetical protein
MGLSIHYNGQINQPEKIAGLIAEITDICRDLNWTSQIIAEPNADKLNGICFAPEGCEPIFLTFLPGGRMCSPVNLMCRDIYEENGEDGELLYTTSTKTQYAGFDAHVAIINLLRYLKEKYFSFFELSDEGLYWETNDKKVLQSQFDKYEFALNSFTAALSEMKAVPGESAMSLADRIEEMIKKKWGNDDDRKIG